MGFATLNPSCEFRTSLHVIASEAKQSIYPHPKAGLLRCARNDDLLTLSKTGMAETGPAIRSLDKPNSRVLDVLLQTRIDQLALHQRQRRLVVQLEIAEGVGEN